MRGSSVLERTGISLQKHFLAVRQLTEQLSSPLSAEDQQIQSMPDVSPTKWHLAHTSWFFETFVLRQYQDGYRVFRSEFEQLFNSYYNSVGDQFPRHRRGMLSRPSLEEVLAYRAYVTEAMELLLESPTTDIEELTTLGIHHEQQHQELLLTDIRHVLFQNPTYPAFLADLSPAPADPSHQAPPLTFVGFEGGMISIGALEASENSGNLATAFHFDNETPRHRSLLGDFELASRPLTNGEVLAFLKAGGYDDPLLWLSDGWAFKKSHNLRHPLYFIPQGDGTYLQFTLNGLAPVNPAETASNLTYFEADALARFMGARLPTEQEWECAASRQEHALPPFDRKRVRPGVAPPSAPGELAQMLGGVWEWTQSPYMPYPGFSPARGAIGEYNGKFMHNQMVLRGGSCATADHHVRVTYRNFFPSNAQWQFSGVRLARGDEAP